MNVNDNYYKIGNSKIKIEKARPEMLVKALASEMICKKRKLVCQGFRSVENAKSGAPL